MEKQKALQKCMKLCSSREYCSFDIRQKLKQWELSRQDINELIDNLESNKFLDNSRYAKAFVNDKIKFNGWGKVKIRFYLKQKQIADSVISDALADFNEQVYHDVLKKEADKKLKSVKAANTVEAKNKAAKYLINKGFEPSLVFNLINNT